MTDLECSHSPPSTPPLHFSLRLSEKTKQKFHLPSRQEELDKVNETPFKNYRNYLPRKLINNFVKERSYYNNPDRIDLFDELSDDNFINDGSSSSSDSDDSTQEGNVQSTSSSDGTSNDDEHPRVSRAGKNRRETTSDARRSAGSDSEEELARPLRTHKGRLSSTGLLSSSGESSGADSPSPIWRKKRRVRVSIQSDGSSDAGAADECHPRSSPDLAQRDLGRVPQTEVEIDINEETCIQGAASSFGESGEAGESGSKGKESSSATSASLHREHLEIKSRPSNDEMSQPLATAPALSGDEATAPEIGFGTHEDTSSSSNDAPDSENGSTDVDADIEPNGARQGWFDTGSNDSFIATSSSGDGTPDSELSWNASGMNRPSHEELICNYRQRKRHRRHTTIREKRRTRRPHDSDSSCPTDDSDSDSATTRLPSERSKRLRKKRRTWEREVLGSYRSEREKKLTKK